MGFTSAALYQSLLGDLRQSVGDQFVEEILPLDSCPPDVTPKQRAAFSISKGLLKKFLESVSPDADRVALSKFLQCNLRCRDWSLQLNTSVDEVLHGEVKNFIYRFLNPHGFPLVDSSDSIFRYGRCGPGASVSGRGYDFYTKLFASPLGCTGRGLYQMYRRYISQFPEWSIADDIRSSHYGDCSISGDSRLSFVPKERSVSRTICIEPSLNMFAQLGLGHIIESRLRGWGINLSTQQDVNRELARVGSESGRFATIDLSSASDSISLRLVDELFPQDFSCWLKFLRTTGCRTPDGTRHELYMVSTMGNGFTFPLQTLIFSAVVLAAMSYHGVEIRHSRPSVPGNWAVNGDDIICETSVSRTVIRLLELYGFAVNKDKTFVEGPFRESCGADFFQGINVRAVYLRKLTTQQDIFSAINQLNLFSARTGIMLPGLVRMLFSACRKDYVPLSENDDAGIKVPLIFTDPVLCPFTQSVLYRPWRVIGRKIRIGEMAIFTPRWLKSRIYNPSGLLISLLQGSVHSSSIGVRHDPPRYKRELATSPFWDFVATTQHTSWYSLERLRVAVYWNLFR